MATNKVIYGGNTLIDLTGDTVTPENLLAGIIAHAASGEQITGTMSAGGVKVERGTFEATADMTGSTSTTNPSYYFEVPHTLGVEPDLVIFYAPSNIATVNTMLMAMRWGDMFSWRSSNYKSICAYHSSSSTATVSVYNTTTSYGICSITSTYFRVKTYSSSTSIYWRAGTYNWIAVKF